MLDELLSSFDGLSEQDLKDLDAETRAGARAELGARADRWLPNPGPQLEAYESEADETFYGGAAGGGKTDLICGLALNEHDNTLILRREATDLRALIARLIEIEGDGDRYNQSLRLWRLGEGRTIELGSCAHEKDMYGYQGRPHDLKAFDEITQFSRTMYRYIIGWNRPALESGRGRRCRVLVTGNPPSTPDGYWVKIEWAPWLDKTFPDPAQPGELRWYTVDQKTGETVWVDEGWRGVDDDGNQILPKSRTFFPALMADNPHLGADYRATIAAMPEPLRSQLMYGDFNVATRDQANQIIPSAWLRAAMDRWSEAGRRAPMVSLGGDIANGDTEDADNTCFCPRHLGNWYDQITKIPGRDTPDGPTGAAAALALIRNGAVANIDLGGGHGGSVYDHLKDNKVEVWGFDGASGATRTAPISNLRFANLRAQALWMIRVGLDPANGEEWQIFPDEELFADLTAPTWTLTPRGILAEPKEKVKKKIGRSPDKGDSFMCASAHPVDDVAAEHMIQGRAMKQRKRRQDNRRGPNPPARDPYDPFNSLN